MIKIVIIINIMYIIVVDGYRANKAAGTERRENRFSAEHATAA